MVVFHAVVKDVFEASFFRQFSTKGCEALKQQIVQSPEYGATIVMTDLCHLYSKASNMTTFFVCMIQQSPFSGHPSAAEEVFISRKASCALRITPSTRPAFVSGVNRARYSAIRNWNRSRKVVERGWELHIKVWGCASGADMKISALMVILVLHVQYSHAQGT